MAPPPRCLVTSLDAPRLDKATVHHLGRVLRLQAGDPLELVDGRGGLATASWSGHDEPEVARRFPVAPPPRAPLWLAVGPPRPSRLDWLVEKAAELGVSRLALLQSRRAARDVRPGRLDRLRRKVGEAMLQCRRLHLMQVDAPLSLEPLLDDCAAAALWVARPPRPSPGETGPGPADTELPAAPTDRPLLVVIGPEGGLDEAEQRLLDDRGAAAVSLGPAVLRVETAAMAVAARLVR